MNWPTESVVKTRACSQAQCGAPALLRTRLRTCRDAAAACCPLSHLQAKQGGGGAAAPKPPPPPAEEKPEEDSSSKFKAFQGKGFSLKG